MTAQIRVITAGFALALAACSPEPLPEAQAIPVRGWDGEIVGDSLEEVPDSIALGG